MQFPFFIDLIISLVLLSLFEGVLKPILSYWGRKKTLVILNKLFQATDAEMPHYISLGYAPLRSFVRGKLLSVLEGEPTSDAQLTQLLNRFETIYSPFQNARNLNNNN